MVSKTKRIGIVATGDELINGDILNTNGQYLCQQLILHGMTPGCEVVVSDDTDEIEQAILYLLQDHHGVITIGGLGPTSDDKTRFGLAKALGVDLEFNDQAWQWIVDMLEKKNLKIPETNRQQALLPKNAEPIFNANGTACACYLHQNGKDIFMLPGPPNECRPIIDQAVINKLSDSYASKLYRKSWLLFSVSESSIADQLEPFMQKFPDCKLGYRVSYPYLEIKLASENKLSVDNLALEFTQVFADNIVSDNREIASLQLLKFIENSKLRIHIDDQATGGALQYTLLNPGTYSKLSFNQNPKSEDFNLLVTITGLQPYWQGSKEYIKLPLTITIQNQGRTQTIEKNIPNRGKLTLIFAVEQIALILLKREPLNGHFPT